MKERSAKMESSPNEIPDKAKRRKLEDIEDQMMKEDLTTLAELFERYRAEYLNDRDDTDGDAKRERTEESVLLRGTSVGIASASGVCLGGSGQDHRRQPRSVEFLEAVGYDTITRHSLDSEFFFWGSSALLSQLYI